MSADIGLVGVGPWGANILRDLKALGANVHAVARSPASVGRAKDGGATSITDHPRKLPDCAGFVIANRTISHLDSVEDLLPRGRPIFVEKPLGTDIERIRGWDEPTRALVSVMHKWRYHPGVLELARIARSGDYGAVVGLRTFRVGWGNPHPDVSSLWILAPHELSIALEILGETPHVIAAVGDPLAPRDAAIAHLRTAAGVPIVFEVSSRHPINIRRVVLQCEEATLHLDSVDYAKIGVTSPKGAPNRVLAVGDDMPLLAQLRAFLEHLAGGPKPKTDVSDEIAVLEAIRDVEQRIAQ